MNQSYKYRVIGGPVHSHVLSARAIADVLDCAPDFVRKHGRQLDNGERVFEWREPDRKLQKEVRARVEQSRKDQTRGKYNVCAHLHSFCHQPVLR